MRFVYIYFLSFLLFSISTEAQIFQSTKDFSRQDTLRGSNTEYRNWWDVQHYSISVEANFDTKFIQGETQIEFLITEDNKGKLMQIDLQPPMKITKAWLDNQEISIAQREGNVYFFSVGNLSKGNIHRLNLAYEGNPKIAVKAPWDGGWIFTKDQKNRPWMSVAVQGLGASAWFPNKDYQGDEPDRGIELKIITPRDMIGVGNGRLKSSTKENGKNVFVWEVKNPINNYNIIPSIGHYVQFQDHYMGEKGKLDLDYYVLDYNLKKAKKQFEQNKSMLACFEHWFGPYPFYEDSYKVIEAPHLGMEHQSGIAYGNQYNNGYLGGDVSGTGHGLLWDFIIIHEAGHEWFGNSITANDVADMWVHEAFTSYAETLYTECQQGKKAADEYNIGIRQNIVNSKPIVGVYGVQQEGSADMYYKGANMLHTLRTWLDNDSLFREILRGLNRDFYHQTVDGSEVENYIAKKSGLDLNVFFDQYLRSINVPTLEIKQNNNQITYRYTSVLPNFTMPLRLENGQVIYPTEKFKIFEGKPEDFRILSTYYIYYKQEE